MSEVLLYDESVAWSGAVVGELRKGGGALTRSHRADS